MMSLRLVHGLIGILCALPVLLVADTNGPALWFPVGEEIRYQISWGPIPVGESEVSSRWVAQEGQTQLVIRLRARSNRIVAAIYPVDDIIESFIDPRTFLPIRVVKKTSEGRVVCDDVLEFDRDHGSACWTDHVKKKKVEYPISTNTQDLMSFMYLLRRDSLTPGIERKVRLAADDQLQDFTIRTGPVEKVDVPGQGEVSCVKLSVDAAKKGFFERKIPGAIWVTLDDRHIVAKMFVKVPVGKVKAVLKDVQILSNHE